uniref:Mediator of RNA polymerase II transcription subunit 23 n=1 Tax=Magallana gigas TaxID=29159 RepID=K1Q882_MAGGI
MSQKSIEDTIIDVVRDILHGEAIEAALCSVILHTEESLQWKKEHCFNSLKTALANVPQESLDTALKCYITQIYNVQNASRVELLLDLLEGLVEYNVVPAKPICDALLDHELLSYNASLMWTKTFQLMRKIIGGVDYKGCRDLLRGILEKCQGIKEDENVSVMPDIDTPVNLVAHILDRNVCLLPAYLAVNEINKVCPEDRKWPHWKMGNILADFVHSFRPAAQMVTVSGRTHLLPVVGYSIAISTSNVWRLSSSCLKFPLNGPLPYDKELSEPQTGLLRYVLEQPYSRDMVCNMLGLNKQWSRSYGAPTACNCVSTEFYLAIHCALAESPPRAHGVLGDFTARPRRALRADCVHKTFSSSCHFSSFRGLDDNVVETPWERGINAEKTSRERNERSNSSLGSLCERSQMESNLFKRCGCAVRARKRRSGIPKDSVKSLCKRNRLITASTLRLAAFLERADGALVALLEILWRCHGDLTTLLWRVYQNAEPRRVLCACSKCAPSHGVLQCSRRSHCDGRRCRCVLTAL